MDCSVSEEFYPPPPENSVPVQDEAEEPILDEVELVPEDILEDDISSLARSESRVEGQREGRKRKLGRGKVGRRGQGRGGRLSGGRQGGGRQGGGRREGRERSVRRGRQGFPRRPESQRIADEEARHYDGYADYSNLDPVYASEGFSHLDPVYAADGFADFSYHDYQALPFHYQGDTPEYYFY